jgi:hypothetical protein
LLSNVKSTGWVDDTPEGRLLATLVGQLAPKQTATCAGPSPPNVEASFQVRAGGTVSPLE